MSGSRKVRWGTALVMAVALGVAIFRTPPAAHASTPVGGGISGNVTWTLAGSPYIMTSTVFVHSGATLTIEAGVTVKVNPGSHRLQVNDGGTLNVNGTATQPVTFTSNAATPAAGDWDYLWFQSTATASLNHCLVQYAGRGNQPALYLDGSTVTLRNCLVANSAQDGIILRTAGQSPLLENVTITNAAGHAIYQTTVDMNPRYRGLTLTGNGVNAVVFPGSSVNRPVTLDGAPEALGGAHFFATGSLSVIGGHTLTVTPGTTLKFAVGSHRLIVNYGGTLIAEGSASRPITFTSAATTPAAGDWDYLWFQSTATASLNHCLVQYAGRGNQPALYLDGSTVTLRNCQVANSAQDGIILRGAGQSPLLENVTITNAAGHAIYQTTVDMNPRYRGLTLTGNGVNAVVFPGSSVNRPVTLDGAPEALGGAHFFATGSLSVIGGHTLTVTPGTTLKFAVGSHRLIVNDGGTLIAEGSASRPITFTSAATTPAAGDWDYLWFQSTATASLNHCLVQYAGRGNQPALYLDGSTVTLRNCQVANSAQDGIILRGAGQSPLLENVTITNAAGHAIYQTTVDMNPRYRGLTLTGNGVNAVVFPGSSVNRPVTLDGAPEALGGAHFFATGSLFVSGGHTLTVTPGTTLKFAVGSHRLIVNDGGTLIAEGSASRPITFTSAATTPAAGDWDYLWFQSTATASLNHCLVQYAGRGNQPALYLDGSTVTLRNCQVGSVAHDGILIRGGAKPLVTGNWFRAPVGRFAVATDTPATPFNATNNFWDHPTGPYHKTNNPFGLGVKVGDGVLFDPWLASQVNTPPTISLLGPPNGTTFGELPVSFTMTVSDVDVRQYQYFRVEILTDAGTPVATFDQRLGGTGWNGPFYRAPATATLQLPLGLPNGAYRWRAAVDDGFGPVFATESRTFNVAITGPAVAGTMPDAVLGEGNQRLAIMGVNLTPTTAVSLRQTISGSVTELAPTAKTFISSNQISITVDLSTRSGMWDVVVREGGVERRAALAVVPALPIISASYVQGSLFTPGRTWTHQLVLKNEGTAAGVAVVGLLPPPGTEPVLNPGAWEGRLGSPDGKSQVLAVSLAPGQRKTISLAWRLPFDKVLAPNAPREVGKVRVGDGLAFQHVVLASPRSELWQRVQAEATPNDLEDLVAGAIGASQVASAAAYETLLRLPIGDETSDPIGDYLARVASVNRATADVLLARWLGTLHEKLLEATGENADSAPLPLDAAFGLREPPPLGGRGVASGSDSWISWAAGELNGFAEAWNTYVASPETAVMLLSEAEGFVDGVSFGLIKPNFGAEYLKCALGVDPWYQSAGQISGNVLSIPVDSVGLAGKGITAAGKGLGQGMRKLSGQWTARYQGTTKTWFNRLAPTYNSPVEPYRIGVDWIDDAGNAKNLVHWGVTGRGEAHVAFGWAGGPLRNRQTGALLLDDAGRPIVGANLHLYNDRVYFPSLRTAFGGRLANWTEFSLGPMKNLFRGAANAYRQGNIADNIYEWWTPPPPDDCDKKRPMLRAAWDPNDITGFPEPPFILPTQSLDLLIRFENLATANLAAENVFITLPLGPNVDLGSVQLGASSHSAALVPSLDATSRVLTLTFQTINLPPNRTPPEGEGYVWLSLAPLPNLPSGATLSFQAKIVFDENPPIFTNRLDYTIDGKAPTSSVVKATDAGSRIAVSVTASDPANGSGVRAVEVAYSQDGTDWLPGGVLSTTTPSGPLSGEVLIPNLGGRVLIMTIAQDAVGNLEDIAGKQPFAITLPARTYLALGFVRAGP